MNSNIVVISSPETVPSEISTIRALFMSGLQQFHIRKPHFSDFDMINYITSIPKEYRKYLVLHSHYYLAKDFGLKGIQVGKNRKSEAREYKNNFAYFGYSAHTFNEILENKKEYTHFFLSPIYNSISKGDYPSNFTSSELSSFLQENAQIKVIALGGVDANNYRQSIDLGFAGIALLGTIWQQEDAIAAFNAIRKPINTRPFVLSIAGFDPSSGAGVSADIKTFEQHKTQGLGVNAAITYQNEDVFLAADWSDFEQIKKQLDILFAKYSPSFVKIGLIENFDVLKQVIALLKEFDSGIKIIWDPILKASANFGFHTSIDTGKVHELLKEIYLVTPNMPESIEIFGASDPIEVQSKLKELKLCKVLLKGGHSIKDKGTDVLIERDNIINFKGKKLANKDKHGTGCVLSSAICSNLAKGLSLSTSIIKAKDYVADFIDSNEGLLGYHHISNQE